jgi:hypothetical protein
VYNVIGIELPQSELVLTKNRDFKWNFTNLDSSGLAINYPAGSLYFELYHTTTPTVWSFTISGSSADLKVESEVVNTVPNRTKWQLVFKPAGEASGGDPVAFGIVRVQA